jgi:hypothetical protein
VQTFEALEGVKINQYINKRNALSEPRFDRSIGVLIKLLVRCLQRVANGSTMDPGWAMGP